MHQMCTTACTSNPCMHCSRCENAHTRVQNRNTQRNAISDSLATPSLPLEAQSPRHTAAAAAVVGTKAPRLQSRRVAAISEKPGARAATVSTPARCGPQQLMEGTLSRESGFPRLLARHADAHFPRRAAGRQTAGQQPLSPVTILHVTKSAFACTSEEAIKWKHPRIPFFWACSWRFPDQFTFPFLYKSKQDSQSVFR